MNMENRHYVLTLVFMITSLSLYNNQNTVQNYQGHTCMPLVKVIRNIEVPSLIGDTVLIDSYFVVMCLTCEVILTRGNLHYDVLTLVVCMLVCTNIKY